MPEKKTWPTGVCTECHEFSFRAEQIGKKCHRVIGPGTLRCGGSYVSAAAPNWSECSSCAATGVGSAGKCEECMGYGWHLGYGWHYVR